MKNVNAIDKIIAELSKRDYIARCKKLTRSQIENIKQGKKTLSDYGGYTLNNGRYGEYGGQYISKTLLIL